MSIDLTKSYGPWHNFSQILKIFLHKKELMGVVIGRAEILCFHSFKLTEDLQCASDGV